jgi:hypothetical protein
MGWRQDVIVDGAFRQYQPYRSFLVTPENSQMQWIGKMPTILIFILAIISPMELEER